MRSKNVGRACIVAKIAFALIVLSAIRLSAQDLAPRAYIITPKHANSIILTWSYYSGGLNFNGAVPITGATGSYHIPILSYYHSFGLFGRSANFTVSLPYGVGTFSGAILGNERSIYRSGLFDLSMRFSVNLVGGPAMEPQEFAKWKQKRILGASLKVIAPTGQYSSTKLVNWGINRWAFKPEVGYSERWGHWVLDGYAGVWFYTENPAFFTLRSTLPQSEKPVGSLEGHLSYSFKARAWVSLDGNFWWGGLTSLNGIENPGTRQTSSRLGVTGAIPVTKHQSIKVAFSGGTYIRYGGRYNNVQVGWQYSWFGWPK